MRFSKKIIFLFTLSLATSFVLAQQRKRGSTEDKYRAINWNTNDGLIWGRVNIMLKDKDGFLWITSEFGLNRFDGNRFINYFADKTKPGTISGTHSIALIEDSLNNIWIGTEKGLSRYDIRADTFTNFTPDPGSENSSTVIIPFWADKEELYCIESYSRIISYNIYTFKKRTLAKPEFRLKHNAVIHSVLDTEANSIWMLPASEDGIIQVSLSTGKTKHYKRSERKTVPYFSEQFNTETMCYDKKRNCIWINSHDGLIQFTLNNKQFHYTYATNPSLNRKEYDHWAGIDIDRNGRIWLATQSKGFIIYDPAIQSVTAPFPDPDHKKISEGNFSIYCDRDGMIWTSSWLKKGIYQLIPSSQLVTRYSPGEFLPKHWIGQIPSIVPADQGRLLIGSQDGLVILDQNTGSTQLLKEKEMPGLKGKFVNVMMIDTVIQKAWLNAWTPDDPGAPDALYEMDIPTKKCRPVILKDTANRVIKPKNIIFYSATAYKNGFIFLDAGNGIFEVDKDIAIAKQVLTTPKNGWVYIADSNKLILKGFRRNSDTYSDINGKWVATPGPLDSIDWSGLFFDKTDHSWWVGVTRQLIHFDKDFHIISRYTEKDGLPGLEINHIIPDNFGNIWFDNSEGIISRLNPKTGQIITLSEKDGFKKQFFQWQPTFIRDAGGILYFAGEDGIDRIDPGKLISYPPSSAYLLSLNINQRSFPLKTGLNNIEKLSLRYFENIITIETGVIDYYSNGKNRIRYKLEGLNENWENAPANYTIRFSKLAHGNYRLLIQASNASNEFNGPVKSLLIHISPAFWNTWWFRIATVLFVAALFYSFLRWRLHQKFILQLERSGKAKQLAELQQQKAELEMQALRAQMNPHFIFNSLNSINRFILQNNKAQASEYLTKFSKLVRMILQNSQASFITLESELEALRLYLDLESLRFEQHFTYNIAVPKDMDTEIIKVPPLIIQPYAENAIWHGLMHKDEKGHLDIEVAQKGNNLYVKITDDGIGRKQAAELASKSATRHKSMGLKITVDRIAMLNKLNGNESPVTINDLVNTDGSAAGTEVLIKIPVLYEEL